MQVYLYDKGKLLWYFTQALDGPDFTIMPGSEAFLTTESVAFHIVMRIVSELEFNAVLRQAFCSFSGTVPGLHHRSL